MKNRKKIIITGASGFLGRNLLLSLLQYDDHRVFAFSSRAEELKECFRHVDKSRLEILNKEALFEERGAEIIKDALMVHCAYPRGTNGLGLAEGLRYIQRVFEAARDYDAEGVINISSQSVYSEHRIEPADEGASVCLESVYAVGKYSVELLLESLFRESDTAWTNVRMASLIGPGFDQRVINKLVATGLSEGRITVKENFQKFGFLDVSDAATAITKMAGSQYTIWDTVYNLGPERGISLCEMATTVRDVFREQLQRDVEIITIPGEENGNSELNSNKFYEAFCFHPAVSFRESVTRILEYDLMKQSSRMVSQQKKEAK